MSAGILLPDSTGVIRRVKKVPFADLSGVQRSTKTGWLGCQDGVTRKIFSSGIPATFFATSATSGATASLSNASDAINCGMSGTISSSKTANNGFGIWFSFVAPTAISGTQQMLALNGTFNINYTSYIDHINFGVGASNFSSYGAVSTGALTSTSTAINATVLHNSSHNNISAGQAVYFYMEIITSVTDGNLSWSISDTFPWAGITWAPTGDKLELAA